MNQNMNLRLIQYQCAIIDKAIGTAVNATGSKGGRQFGLSAKAKALSDVWSEMATRNVLSELLLAARACSKEIGDLSYPHRAATASARTECANLIKRIEAELPRYNVTKQRYKEVVCFGYKTALPDYKVSSKVDDREDMKQKCADMKKAIQSAYAFAGQGGGKNSKNSKAGMLKVFVAPEFFFRGRNGAYDHAVVAGVAEIKDDGRAQAAQPGLVEIMAEEIGQPQYKDWLFVLGTAVAATRYSRPVCKHPGCKGQVVYKKGLSLKAEHQAKTIPQCSLDPAHTVGEAFAVAQVDNVGFIFKEGECHTVTKELISGLDYKDNKVGVDGEELEAVAEKHLNASKFQDERMGGCIFTIDGLTIGVELCLDHADSARNPNAGRLEHAGNIQLQLIPSYGMSIKKLRTIKGGVVFNVDGQTPHVEAIGGTDAAVTSTLYDEWVFRPNDPLAVNSIGTDVNKLLALGNAGGGDWKQVAPASSTAAPNGSIVMYGPYSLPTL
jgi:hypothetical protein